MNRELTTEEKIIRELAEKHNPYDRNFSSRHLFNEGFIIGYEFSKNAEQFKDAVLKAPESKLPTKEELTIEIIARFSTKTSRGTSIARNGFIDCYNWIEQRMRDQIKSK